MTRLANASSRSWSRWSFVGAAARADDVLHEERHLAHHRSPAGFVPADGSVREGHLELAVVDLPFRQLVQVHLGPARQQPQKAQGAQVLHDDGVGHQGGEGKGKMRQRGKSKNRKG